MIGVTVVTKEPDLARSLWDRGWPVTAQSGRAENGPVTILSVPVDRRDEARLHRDVQSIAPDAVCTTRDLRAPNSAYQSDPPKRCAPSPSRPVRWHRLQTCRRTIRPTSASWTAYEPAPAPHAAARRSRRKPPHQPNLPRPAPARLGQPGRSHRHGHAIMLGNMVCTNLVDFAYMRLTGIDAEHPPRSAQAAVGSVLPTTSSASSCTRPP